MVHVGNVAAGVICGGCAAAYRASPVGEPIPVPAEWAAGWDGQVVTPVHEVGEAESVSMEPCSGCGSRALGARHGLTIRLTVPEVPASFVAADARRVEVADGAVSLVALEG